MDIIASTSKIDPTGYDITVSSLLIGLGAEEYADIFRKNNIGQSTLMELTEEDLVKLGVDDASIRTKLIAEVKNLPIYETSIQSRSIPNLGPLEIVDILEESSQHLYRIYLSMLSNTLALKKTNHISDNLLHNDKYASDIAVETLSEINNILNSMDVTLHTQMKALTMDTNCKRNKKIFVGAVGGMVVTVLAILFVKSVKQLN